MKRQTTIVESGRTPISSGVRHAFGLTIRPEQMLEFFHDVMPHAPIPFDARFEMLEFEDKGEDSEIGFYFTSIVNPLENCVRMGIDTFFQLLKKHGEGIIPTDAALDGIEVSNVFTVILLRVKSDHFPPHAGNEMPLAHLRYEAGELVLLNVFEAIKKERRIQISGER
jgi:hypothetical protein